MNNQNDPLNQEQRQAVESLQKYLLIVAGPGTGKTHTLTYRIARSAEHLSADQRAVAVTFTHKAAEQLRKRLKLISPKAASRVFVGTFHQFCLMLLKEYIGMPVSVADPERILALAKGLWPDHNGKEIKKHLDLISAWKNTPGLSQPKEAERYEACLQEEGLMDFDDILRVCCQWLAKSQNRQQVQAVYRMVFVDEYQDVNARQHTLLTQLVEGDVTLTAIGDPHQAIYGFRGSDVRFFQEFIRDFPQAGVISLSKNYRSASFILKASSQVIEKGTAFTVPALTAQIHETGQLNIHSAASEKSEAEYIVHTIERLVGGTSLFSQDSGRVQPHEEQDFGFGDIAILFRLNHQARALKEALDRHGIPYQWAKDEAVTQVDGFIPQVDKVSLLTLHAAKGLEFPVVMIIGCEDGLMPLSIAGMSSSAEEERRLFYVGITRAQKRIYISHAKKRFLYGQSYANPVSPFVLDIEDQLKQMDQAKEQRAFKPKPHEVQMKLFK